MKKTWRIWLTVSKKISFLLADILLTIIYIVIIIPFGFFMQSFFRKTLLGRIDRTNKNSYWIKRGKIIQDLSWAKEQ